MAWARKRPSGRFQGIAVHPNGSKRTQTFPLKRQAIAWAEELEATWRRDRSFDPRAGEITFADWVAKWLTARNVEASTAKKNDSHRRNHLARWNTWPLNSIDRLDVGAWIGEMNRAGVGAHTIEAAVHHFSSAMQAAVDSGLIQTNPAGKQQLPKPAPTAPRFFTDTESALILDEVANTDRMWRVACDLDMHVGLRLGELLGLRVEAVDWERAGIHVTGVMTRSGWRPYAKSKRSHRTVPIPDHLLDYLAPYVIGRDPEEPVFAGARGSFVSDVNFRNRIWTPAVDQAGRCAKHRLEPCAQHTDATPVVRARCDECRQLAAAVRESRRAKCSACVPVLRESPHTMRHTAASRLVMKGVDLYRVQALLGHESYTTTLRYAHLAPSATDLIREAWRNSGAPTVPDT